MRALLGILCLFATAPSDRLGGAAATAPDRAAEIGALLAAITPAQPDPGTVNSLPSDLDEALTAWIAGHAPAGRQV